MCCGAATGRLGFFLDWMEDHEDDEEQLSTEKHCQLPPLRIASSTYYTEKPLKSEQLKTEVRGWCR